MQTYSVDIHSALRSIVRTVTADENLHDDLFQEACLHLWKRLADRPGQTRSWYLQSCRFYLLKLLASGLSLDAPSRRANGCTLDQLSEVPDAHCPIGLDLVFDTVSAQDLFVCLCQVLTPVQERVLRLLAEGFQTCEIAAFMGISHQAVSCHQIAIAQAARDPRLRA